MHGMSKSEHVELDSCNVAALQPHVSTFY